MRVEILKERERILTGKSLVEITQEGEQIEMEKFKKNVKNW